MKLPKLLIAGLTLLVGFQAPAQADDGLDGDYHTMLNIISRMRILSENCRLQFDGSYDANFLSALAEKDVNIEKAAQDLIDYYKDEKGRMPTDCPDDANSSLQTLDTIYKYTLKSIRKS